METSDIVSALPSDDSGTEEDNEQDGLTSVPGSSFGGFGGNMMKPKGIGLPMPNGGFSIDLDDLDEISGSHSKSSFPSIHFSRSISPGSESSGSGGGSEAEHGDAEGGGSSSNGGSSGSGGTSGSGSSLGLEANGHHTGHLIMTGLFEKSLKTAKLSSFPMPPPLMSRTLYIQMVSCFPVWEHTGCVC